MTDDLEGSLAVAMAAKDIAKVVETYMCAAEKSEAAGDRDQGCFLLTQAWVFALEAGDSRAEELRARLIAQGRETEQ